MTELTEIMRTGTYWLGRIEQIHEVGDFAIIEYHERDFLSSSPTHGAETGKYKYAVFVLGESIGESAQTLEKALILAALWKYGVAPAAPYVWRMMENDPCKEYRELKESELR